MSRLDRFQERMTSLPSDVRLTLEAIDAALAESLPDLTVSEITMGLVYKRGHRTLARLDPKPIREGGYVMACVPRGGEHVTKPEMLERTSRGGGHDFVRILPSQAKPGAQFVAEMAKAAAR